MMSDSETMRALNENENHSQENHSEGNRSQKNHSQENRSQENSSQENRSQENRSEGNHSQENRSEGNRSEGNHSQENHSQENRSEENRSEHSVKLKLVRSGAVCEELGLSSSSSQQDEDLIKLSQTSDEESALTVNEEEDQTATKLEIPEKEPRNTLSRDSSQEYKDSTGIDLHGFLVNTLRNHPRDRMMLLKLEQDLLDFISSNQSQRRKFPPMTSYHRMLLHRVAAYFGLDHNVDQSGKCVIINKTSSTRVPDQKFSEHITDDKTDDFQKRYILKRDNSGTDKDDMRRMKLKDDRRSKSIEEREEEYQRARDRIFADGLDTFPLDNRIQEDEVCSSIQQRRQIFSRLKDSLSWSSLQSSSESEPRPWSSTDSDSSSRNLRPVMTKASSFSGVPLLTRGDSSSSSMSTGLSNTGSGSCSSVGSYTGSLSRSQAFPALSYEPPASTASASYYLLPLDGAGVASGSVLVSSHTGQPLLNPDGSAVLYTPSVTSQTSRCQSSVAPPPGAHPQHQPTNHITAQHPLSYPAPPNQPFTVENLSAQLGHMALVQQASGEVCPPQSGYGQPSTPSVSQQQMPVCYCCSGQFPVCNQSYRPVTPVSYSGPGQIPPTAPQQPGYTTVMPNQQNYQNMLQPAANHSRAGHPPHGMMVQYPSVPSYQVTAPASSVQVYYSVLPPSHSTTSSSAGFQAPPGAEQMSYQCSSSPCGSQQIPSQQCSGGMLMMHLALPVSQQSLSPSLSPSAQQWKHTHYSSGHTHGDVCAPEPSRSSPQALSSSSSLLQCPAAHLTNVKHIDPSLGTLPIMPHFSGPGASGAGDVRFQLRPPLLQAPPTLSSQAPAGPRPPARGRRPQRRALSSDLS